MLNTAPRLALALRQTVRNRAFTLARDAAIPDWQDAGVRGHAQGRMNPLYLATVLPTRLDDIATECFNNTPQAIAEAGFAIAAHLDGRGDERAPQFVKDAVTAQLGDRLVRHCLILDHKAVRASAL